MAMDQEAVERFDRLDRQIAAWCAVIAANSKAVADMSAAECRKVSGAAPFHRRSACAAADRHARLDIRTSRFPQRRVAP